MEFAIESAIVTCFVRDSKAEGGVEKGKTLGVPSLEALGMGKL